jgi:predicted nucleic acid-binding protein
LIRVVDASVAAKWVVAEPGSDAARRVLAAKGPLIAPDLLVAEVGNVLWKKAGRGLVGTDQAREALVWLPELFDRLFDAAALAPRAIEIAIAYAEPLSDCLYVALAELAGPDCRLVTADRGLRELALQAGLPATRVELVQAG